MEIAIGEWKLRPWELTDIPSLAKYANNRRIWLNLRDAFPHPYTERDAREWIERCQGQDPLRHFAIASADEAIGDIGVRSWGDVYRRSEEIGYWLGEPFWNRGITTLAVKAMVEYAWETFDVVRLFATVFEWNPASARVLEKAGFTLEGRMRKSVTKDGKTMDSLMYAMVREPR